MKTFIAAVALVLVGVVSMWTIGATSADEPSLTSSTSTTQPTTNVPADFRKADGPRQWSFPRDHGRHDDFQTEWWYFTGNVEDGAGHEYGYQLTIFRYKFAAHAPQQQSPWATNALYFGHAHISDISARRHHHHQRSSRAHPKLAFAADDELDVKLVQWHVKRDERGMIMLKAKEENFEIDLQLDARNVKPVLQGKGGLSRKSAKPGYASYYYSLTRMKTTGTLVVGGKRVDVAGLSWMDQEFSSRQIADHLAGWDWMSLHLNDGRDVMVYRLRTKTGETDIAFGSVVSADRQVTRFTTADIVLEGSDLWTSPHSGGKYPLNWKVKLGSLVEFTAKSRYADQEMLTDDSAGTNYYEGAIEILNANNRRIGKGYLEMTGYDKPMTN